MDKICRRTRARDHCKGIPGCRAVRRALGLAMERLWRKDAVMAHRVERKLPELSFGVGR